MAYQSGTATSQEDLMSQFRTFLTANGWTEDDWDTTDDQAAFHQGSVYVQFHWDNTDEIAVFQSLSHDGSAPGSNPNDSGNTAAATGAISNGMVMQTLNNGAYSSYHFFTDNSAEIYAYLAVEVSSGIWRFMGFGELVKIGDWTGGEFSFGTYISQSAGQLNVPTHQNHSQILDAVNTDVQRAGYLHMEGLPGMAASSKWGVFSITGTPGNDDAANARYNVIGSSRGAFWTNTYMWFPLSPLQGLVPLLPMNAWYWRKDTTPDHITLLGTAPDIRQVNIGNFEVEQEVTIGGDTWVLLPHNQKIAPTASNINQSGNAGYAFKKVP